MILSDETIKEEVAAGRIVIDPLQPSAIQPSSVDLHVDRFFRVFRNDTTPFIDPKESQEDLTELVEVADGRAFILHPGEFVLGSTLERVALPHDLVARLEGKSSLGRLGLLIHSSLPASELVLVLHDDGRLRQETIESLVQKCHTALVAAFDPDSFRVGYQRITGWYEGPADRIYEVRLASGRRVRVTAGHCLFGLDRAGELVKIPTTGLRPGTRVAVPGTIPDPASLGHRAELDILTIVPEDAYADIVYSGPRVAAAFTRQSSSIAAILPDMGIGHPEYYRARSRLPLLAALQLDGVVDHPGPEDRLFARGGRFGLPRLLPVDSEFAWMLGLYVAEGYRRATQVVISNTDQGILDRAEAVLDRIGQRVYRAPGAITCCSTLFARVLGWLGTGGGAHAKRVPPVVMGWPRPLLEAFLDGVVDGDGSRDEARTSIWTTSEGLVSDLLLVSARLGRRAGSCERRGRRLFQVYLPEREHKLLTAVPLPDQLLVDVRMAAGLGQARASALAGYRHATDLCNIERRYRRDAVRMATLRRLHSVYAALAPVTPEVRRLSRLVDGDLLWDRVIEVRDTGSVEPVYDLEVRPNGRRIENFVAGNGAVFVSNTAGFVDAGWDGHLTLELSNVANLPIAIYPGMKIGQISFLRMTTPAENPYGSASTGSKYQGQRGPTPSRYYLNFRDR